MKHDWTNPSRSDGTVQVGRIQPNIWLISSKLKSLDDFIHKTGYVDSLTSYHLNEVIKKAKSQSHNINMPNKNLTEPCISNIDHDK